jgi:hypothetical protein
MLAQELFLKAVAKCHAKDTLSVYLFYRLSRIYHHLFKVDCVEIVREKSIMELFGLESDEQRIGKALEILEQSLHEFKKQYHVQADPSVLKIIQLIPLVLEEVQILQGKVIKAIVHPKVEEELIYLREKKEKYKRAYQTAADELRNIKSNTMLSSSSVLSNSSDIAPMHIANTVEVNVKTESSLQEENRQLMEQVRSLESQLGDLRLQLFKMNSASGLHNVNWNSQTLVKQMDQLRLQNQSIWSSIVRLFTGELAGWIQWETVLSRVGITTTSAKAAPKLGRMALIGSFVPFCYDLLKNKLQTECQKNLKVGIEFWKKRKAMPNDIYDYFLDSWMDQSIVLDMMEYFVQFVSQNSALEPGTNTIDLDTANGIVEEIDVESPLFQKHKSMFPTSLHIALMQKLNSLHDVLLKSIFMCILMEVELFSSPRGSTFDENRHNEDDIIDQGQLIMLSTFPGVKIAGQIAIKEQVLLD